MPVRCSSTWSWLLRSISTKARIAAMEAEVGNKLGTLYATVWEASAGGSGCSTSRDTPMYIGGAGKTGGGLQPTGTSSTPGGENS